MKTNTRDEIPADVLVLGRAYKYAIHAYWYLAELTSMPVSYTHLDVYKRQYQCCDDIIAFLKFVLKLVL